MDQHIDRRKHHTEELRRLLEHVVKDQRSLRKNGHTWGEYFGKLITPERVILVALLVFEFGGRVNQFDTDLTEQQRRTNVMEEQHKLLNARMDDVLAMTRRLSEQQQLAADEASAVRRLAEHATQQNANIQARMRATPTRNDVNATTNQQIVPRLERIEKQLRDLPTGAPER